MRNIISFLAIFILIVSCNNNSSNDTDPPIDNPSGIIIKGVIPRARQLGTRTNSISDLTLADAKKVLVITNNNSASLFDLSDSTFSISAQLGTGVALLFLDANNRYIGNLSAKGLNMFPLGRLSNGDNTTIDLSTLRLEGTNVIPSHDPLGNEIVISDAEIKSLKSLGEYYESIAKNMDADNDSVPDILSRKQIMLNTTFGFNNCGRWGHNDTLPIINDSSAFYIHYSINMQGGDNLRYNGGSKTFTGPEGDPYTNIIFDANEHANEIFRGGAYRPTTDVPANGYVTLPFKKGTYTLTLDDKAYTLNYANNDAYSNLVLVVPTLHTNPEGQLTSISLTYQFMNGAIIPDPSNMLTDVSASIVNQRTGQTVDICNGSQRPGSECVLSIATGFNAIVPDTPVQLFDFDMVAFWYHDLLGNWYVIIWNSKKTPQNETERFILPSTHQGVRR